MKKYSIIYADPPWAWSKTQFLNRGRARTVEKEYPTLSIYDIASLSVDNITSEDAVLFLWITSPKLPYAFNVMGCWGFDYKTVGFVWIKKNKLSNTNFFGMGFYTRQNAEFCLIGTKGKGLKRLSNSIEQVIESKKENHSKKPDIVRNKIVELYGDLPRLELFARNKQDGWDVWGNEVESDVEL